MDLGIYGYKKYQDYLAVRLGGQGTRTGLKKRAAESLGVNTTLISQVLHGSCDLSLEQAERMNVFLSHSDDEADYFILLVLWGRAGTATLKKRFASQIDVLREKRVNISARVTNDKTISPEDQQRFYSSFIHSAIHVCSSIPKYNKANELSRLLGVSELEVQKALDFMKKIGVVTLRDGHIFPGTNHVHLSKDSLYIINHHLNWRLKAIDQIRKNPKEGLHYSGAVSLSEEDVLVIREILVGAISQATKIAVKSKEEAALVLCVDFYEFAKG